MSKTDYKITTRLTHVAAGLMCASACAHAAQGAPHTPRDAEYQGYAKLIQLAKIPDSWIDFLAQAVRDQHGQCTTNSVVFPTDKGWDLSCDNGRRQYEIAEAMERLIVRQK
jgi:hypothetical protein